MKEFSWSWLLISSISAQTTTFTVKDCLSAYKALDWAWQSHMPRNCKNEVLSIILCKIAQIWAKLSKVFLCLYFLSLFYNEYSLCGYILGNYNCFTNDFLRSIPHQAKLSKVVQSCAKFCKVVQSCAKLRKFVQSFFFNFKVM